MFHDSFISQNLTLIQFSNSNVVVQYNHLKVNKSKYLEKEDNSVIKNSKTDKTKMSRKKKHTVAAYRYCNNAKSFLHHQEFK